MHTHTTFVCAHTQMHTHTHTHTHTQMWGSCRTRAHTQTQTDHSCAWPNKCACSSTSFPVVCYFSASVPLNKHETNQSPAPKETAPLPSPPSPLPLPSLPSCRLFWSPRGLIYIVCRCSTHKLTRYTSLHPLPPARIRTASRRCATSFRPPRVR